MKRQLRKSAKSPTVTRKVQEVQVSKFKPHESIEGVEKNDVTVKNFRHRLEDINSKEQTPRTLREYSPRSLTFGVTSKENIETKDEFLKSLGFTITGGISLKTGNYLLVEFNGRDLYIVSRKRNKLRLSLEACQTEQTTNLNAMQSDLYKFCDDVCLGIAHRDGKSLVVIQDGIAYKCQPSELLVPKLPLPVFAIEDIESNEQNAKTAITKVTQELEKYIVSKADEDTDKLTEVYNSQLVKSSIAYLMSLDAIFNEYYSTKDSELAVKLVEATKNINSIMEHMVTLSETLNLDRKILN